MSEKKHKNFWFILGILFLVNLLLGYVMIYKAENADQHLIYGDRINNTFGKDSNGNPIDLVNGKWHLILYLDHKSNTDKQIAKYANILYDRFQDKELEVIGIFEGKQAETDAFKNVNSILYPLFSVHNLVSIPHLGQGSGIVLIDTNNEVRFAGQLSQELIRQLVEKHLIGSITYNPNHLEEPLKNGKLFPDIRIKPLTAKQELQIHDVINKNTILFVFTSSCASCGVKSYLRIYSKLEKLLLKDKERNDHNIRLIFSSKFTQDEIRHYLSEIEINSIIYLAQEEISGIESSYFSSYLHLNDKVVAFELDERRYIHSIKKLSYFENMISDD